MDNDFLATGLLFLIIHEITYFGKSLPWFLIDRFGIWQQYKIQQNKPFNEDEQADCLKEVLIAHAFIESLPIFAFHPICVAVGLHYTAETFPTLREYLTHIAIFFLIEDTWHYWFHRALHYGPLYKHIHKQHHKYSAPFGLTAEYAHPIEVAVTGLGTVGSPVLWAYYFKNVHLITVISWVILRLFQAVDSHSGYDFPWSLRHFLPIWAGADHHDDHHHYFVGNYASSFRHWDFILGTETPATARRHTLLKSGTKKSAKA